MRALREFAREYFHDLLAATEALPEVHGIHVDFDPLWLDLWRRSQSLTPAAWERVDAMLSNLPLGYAMGSPWSLIWGELENPARRPAESPGEWSERRVAPGTGLESPATLSEVHDFKSQTWSELEANWLREPIVVSIVLLPGAPRPEVILARLAERRPAVRFAWRPLPVAVARPTDEVRPLVGGLSVGTDPPSRTGTLGGILSDGHKRFALSCAHVLDTKGAATTQPSAGDSATQVGTIGTVRAVSQLQPNSLTTPQQNYNHVDAALIELDAIGSELEVLGVGAVDGVGEATYDERVEVAGKHGLRPLVAGPLAASQDIEISGQRHTFLDLTCLHEEDWALDPVLEGDSGAWALRTSHASPGPSREWCGVVIGCGGALAYATPSRAVMTWLESEGYEGLTIR